MDIRATARRHPVKLTAVFIVVTLLLRGVFSGYFGQIGKDSDDVMRLVQIKDFLDGQGWFDPYQHRMGPGIGTEMHWSRLVDLPIILLISVFDLFLPRGQAISVAIVLWPPLLALPIIWGISRGIRFLGGQHALIFGLLLLGFWLIPHYRFLPGSIDHHNIQLAFLALAAGFALDPERRAGSFAISGTALALCVAIGPEVYIFAGVVCAWFALVWLFGGRPSQSGTIAFGLAFAAALIASFFITVGPSRYGIVACDQMSFITVAAGVLGGAGLAANAWLMSGRSLVWRLAGLGVLAVLCAALFLSVAPQCLGNPLSDLPPEVKTLWLDNITEAQPVLADQKGRSFHAPFALGAPFVALLVSLWRVHRREHAAQYGLLAALLFVSLAMTLYQIRFSIFGNLIAIPALAPWVGELYAKSRGENSQGAGYILALALSMPLIWGFPGAILFSETDDTVHNQERAAACYSDDVMTFLAGLEPGMIAATDNGTAFILHKTNLRALSGNYHRNTAGIGGAIHIFTADAAEAEAILSTFDVDYVYVCRATAETTIFTRHSPKGLMADLVERRVPSYLEPAGPDLEGGTVSVYGVIR